jgi:hypothetical protein
VLQWHHDVHHKAYVNGWQGAEEALQEFREERRVVELETEAREQVGRLAELQAQRAALAAERDALTQLLGAIEARDEGGRPDYRTLVAFPTFLRNQTVGTLVGRLVEAETRRTELRERWSPTHTGIVALDSAIHDLEARLGEIGRDYRQSLDDQIASQPAAVGAVLDRDIPLPLDPRRPILFTGEGTSLHACRIAATWAARLSNATGVRAHVRRGEVRAANRRLTAALASTRSR